MKVLQVGKYFPPVNGGIENNVHALSVGLLSRYDVTALVFNTSRETREEMLDGVHVVRVGTMGKVLSTEISPGFFKWFRRLSQADVVHLHTPNPIGELACLATPRSARLIITYHSDVIKQKLLGRLDRILLHKLMKRADKIIAYTKRYQETSPVISRYPDKSVIIPHGIDLSEFELTPEIEKMVQALRGEHGDKIALFVGRLVYYKGADVLLKAMATVPDAKVLIIGDGPMRGTLESLVEQLGISNRAVFLGRQSHVGKVAAYHACDFLALPATHRSEAFGQVQVEALACRKPVISTDIDSGVPFVNKHGETGLVVPPENPEALAGAIRTLLDDADLRQRMGEAGRARAEALFSREVMVRDSLDLYDRTLKGREQSA